MFWYTSVHTTVYWYCTGLEPSAPQTGKARESGREKQAETTLSTAATAFQIDG